MYKLSIWIHVWQLKKSQLAENYTSLCILQLKTKNNVDNHVLNCEKGLIMENARDHTKRLSKRTSVYLWEFLLEMLEDEECGQSIIIWLNKSQREFMIEDPDEVAKLWGLFKNRPSMNKKKFCRAIRYYYNSRLISKIQGKIFSYRFGELPYHHHAFKLP